MIFYKAATVAAMLIVLEGPGGHALAQYYFPGAYPPAQAPLNQPVPLDPNNEFYAIAEHLSLSRARPG